MTTLPEQGMLLRIFIGETDKYQGKPLYEQILLEARKLNLAGTTVLRGILGFGATSHVHSAKFLDLSEDLPIVVEIVDTEESLKKILPFLDETVKEGLITMEEVKVLKYRHNKKTGRMKTNKTPSASPRRIFSHGIILMYLAAALAGTLVHDTFIDSRALDVRKELHGQVLAGTAPAPVQYRVFMYYAAEGMMRLGVPFRESYDVLRFIFIFLCALAFHAFLSVWFLPWICAGGLSFSSPSCL